MSSKFSREIDSDYAEQYQRIKIAMLTGWTFEYIDSLGMYDFETLYQVYESEQSLKNAGNSSKSGSKTRT